MIQLRLPIFTSKIKYYNLRIVPPKPVFDKVMEVKKEFEIRYGKQPLARSKPHVTIATFKMNSKHQDFLLQVLGRLSQRQAFTTSVDGFDVFEGSRTLYMNVLKNEALEAIHQEVRSLYSGHLRGKVKLFNVSDNPHLTISKTKGKKMLYESLEHCRKNQYSRQMDVGHLTVVSRLKYRTWDWEHQIGLS